MNGPVSIPKDASERKKHPVGTGVLDYFPDALLAVARCSWQGNEQHNPGTPLHWDRSKSQDEADALIRHFMERGTIDSDGVRHSAKMAWRALALLQKEIEAESTNGVFDAPEIDFSKVGREPLTTTESNRVRDPQQHDRNRQHQEEAASEQRKTPHCTYREALRALEAEKPHDALLWKGQHPVVDL